MIPEDQYIRIGIISGVHGIAGRLKVVMTTSFGSRFDRGKRIFLKKGASYVERVIADFKIHKGKTGLLYLEGVASRESAELLKGTEIFIPVEEAIAIREELEEDEFLYADIIGADVYYNENFFAQVEEIIESGGGYILLMRGRDNKEYMVPFVESMVDTSRLSERILKITPAEGLLDI